MAACNCPGCGGHAEFVAEQRAKANANREDFEAWLAAGKPDIERWHAERIERETKARAQFEAMTEAIR